MYSDVLKSVNLSEVGIEVACYWLIDKLDLYNDWIHPYASPYFNYVLTWHRAIPIRAIIMAQSPYPNNIYSQTAAAMSYSEDLCLKIMGVHTPPTAEVLANDLVINAGVDRNNAINNIRDGWKLIDKGILIVNECVLKVHNTSESFDESTDQRSVLLRLLRETEKHGKRTVDVFALGTSGARMASSLISGYKSNIIRLSKHTASHPASLSYRFKDLRDPKCHMDCISFSKLLSRYLCNDVANIYDEMYSTKPKKDDNFHRQMSITSTLGKLLKDISTLYTEMAQLHNTQASMDPLSEEYRNSVSNLANLCTKISEKLVFTGSTLVTLELNSRGVSGHIVKTGPSLTAVNPSSAIVASHVGAAFEPQVQSPTKIVVKKMRKSQVSTTVTPAPSVCGTEANELKSPMLKRSDTGTTGQLGTEISTDTQSIVTPSESTVEISVPIKRLPMRKKAVTTLSQPGIVSKDTQYILEKSIINQLSCVEAVVMAGGVDTEGNANVKKMLDDIQSDIKAGVASSNVVKQLLPCIKSDVDSINDFEFANWAVDVNASEKNAKSSTYVECKRLFKF